MLDERGNMFKARVVELINEFDDKLDRDPLRCKFKIKFERSKIIMKSIKKMYNNVRCYYRVMDVLLDMTHYHSEQKPVHS